MTSKHQRAVSDGEGFAISVTLSHVGRLIVILIVTREKHTGACSELKHIFSNKTRTGTATFLKGCSQK